MTRNGFHLGYSINLEVNTAHNEYVINNYDQTNFPNIGGGGIITELILNNFANAVLTNTRDLTTDILDLFVIKLSRATKLPM